MNTVEPRLYGSLDCVDQIFRHFKFITCSHRPMDSCLIQIHKCLKRKLIFWFEK